MEPADVLPGPQFAEGRTAEIFALVHDRVIKLYRPGFPRSVAEQEADITRRVHDAAWRRPVAAARIEEGFPAEMGRPFAIVRGSR